MARVRLLQWLDTAQQGQRGYLMPWAPVCFGLGIGLYFALPVEPGVWAYRALTAAALRFTKRLD